MRGRIPRDRGKENLQSSQLSFVRISRKRATRWKSDTLGLSFLLVRRNIIASWKLTVARVE